MHILVADEQAQVRFALRVLLGRQPGLQIVGEAGDAGELLAQARVKRPDLVLFHWRLQGLAAADLVPAVRGLCPDLSLIALSARPEARQPALVAGADAFVSKMDPPERLLSAIRSVS